jgi:hypothetical protein
VSTDEGVDELDSVTEELTELGINGRNEGSPVSSRCGICRERKGGPDIAMKAGGMRAEGIVECKRERLQYGGREGSRERGVRGCGWPAGRCRRSIAEAGRRIDTERIEVEGSVQWRVVRARVKLFRDAQEGQ